MSKVFITKNGQFLSRGEGVLTQVENPDLEVNDIGVEVSEKIAEDVKEGDLVFNRVASVDFGQSYQHIYGLTSARFVKNDDGLFCVIFGREFAPAIQVMQYVDDRWVSLTGSNRESRKELSPGARLVAYDSAALSLSSNKILWAGINDEGSLNYYFNSMGYIDGGVTTELSLDLSSVPLHHEYNSSNYAESISVDLKEFSGGYYAVYSFLRNTSPDTSGPTIFAYKIDTENNRITSIPCEPNTNPLSNTSSRCVNLFEYNNELYCATHNCLYKYDEPTNTFVFLEFVNGHNNKGGILTTSSNDIYYFTYNWGIRIHKFNPSTSALDLIVNENILSGIVDRPITGRAYETSDGICVAIFRVPEITGEHDGGVYKFNTDTSTLTSLGSIGPFRKGWGWVGGPNESAANGSDIIEYNGEHHLLKHAYYGEMITFYKSTDGRNFTRNTKWDVPPTGQFMQGVDVVDFSGTTLMFKGSRGMSNTICKYDSSGDYFDPFGRTDVHRYASSSKFIQLSGDLYMITASEQSPYVFAYKYDVSAEQFYKLADTVTLPAYSHHFNTINFSGTQYFAFHQGSNTLPLKTATFDGSSFTLLADPSTVHNSRWDSHAPALFENNGKLFMALDKRNTNQTSGDIGWYTYQLDGSSWIDVDPGPFENWVTSGIHHERRNSLDPSYDFNAGLFYNITPFKIGSRQLLLTHSNSYNTLRVYEYIDGSGWFLDQTEQLPQIKAYQADIEVPVFVDDNGDIYFYKHAKGIIIRRSNGKWEHHPADWWFNTRANICMVKLNGDINVFVSSFNDGLKRYKISDFLGQSVWYKTKVYDDQYDTIRSKAYGIALQDGSKGDIIKIRRIKR